jgi:hypothetical protein
LAFGSPPARPSRQPAAPAAPTSSTAPTSIFTHSGPGATKKLTTPTTPVNSVNADLTPAAVPACRSCCRVSTVANAIVN